jgi:hypothetical protein
MKFSYFLWLFLFAGIIYGQEFKKKIYVNQTDTLPYRLLLPDNYNPKNRIHYLFFFMELEKEETITRNN